MKGFVGTFVGDLVGDASEIVFNPGEEGAREGWKEVGINDGSDVEREGLGDE